MASPAAVVPSAPSSSSRRSWDSFSSWIHSICVVTFDLELGQAIECVYPPHVELSKQEASNTCYLAFPDSNSGCMGDTLFTFRLRQAPGPSSISEQHSRYNSGCPSFLQVDQAYLWGYVYFRQVQDPSLPRGYFQKSLVLLSKLPFNSLFLRVVSLIAPEYFQVGRLSLEAACVSISSWPAPVPGEERSLPLVGTVISVVVPSSQTGSVDGTIKSPLATDVKMFERFAPILSHVYLLWELVLTAEPIVVMAGSPTVSSEMVLALVRMIAPLKYSADYRPYFTIHDSEFKDFTNKSTGPPSVILGVTNPFFTKTLNHWPHTIYLGSESNGDGFKCKLKKSRNMKVLDSNPGLYTQYRPFLQKDKALIKNLMVGISSGRPGEVQNAMLRRQLLELTQSFMIPLERYMASLMPLQKNISPFKAAPTPLPFKPDDFLVTLESSGPQLTSGIRGDWVGLYKKFFKSANFNDWFNTRYSELAVKLQALQLKALAETDLKEWVRGKPEVEVVDMVLKIRNKLDKIKDMKPQFEGIVRERLSRHLQDIIYSLPEDTRNILLVNR